jgi:tRNA-specific 2-thiouridylase
MMKPERIVVGVSGGVDSSVAALLLLEQGFQVEALFMKNWDERDAEGGCIWEADVADAIRVCDRLGIRLNTVDLSREYWDRVFLEFIEEYRNGRTPNPDILCNQEVKFRAFLEHALELGADRIATGHYARITETGGVMQLRKGIDANKDQSYFLCRLNQTQLAQSLFPIGDLHKPEVRKLARKAGLITHDKKDSTGICFVGERPFREFLSRYLPVAPGEIRTPSGESVGEHQGIHFYTLGQRQGLGIGGVRGHDDAPWYVVAKDIAHNVLVVSQGHDHSLLMSRSLTAVNLHWTGEPPATLPFACRAKTRYRQADQDCLIIALDDEACSVRFAERQRAVTPGQYVVFYDGDVCLGGGVIDSTAK